MISFFQGLLYLALLFLCLFMILIILLQRGKGGGLVGAFGGLGGSSAFGAKTGDVFLKITIVSAIIWFVLCLGGRYILSARSAKDGSLVSGSHGVAAAPASTESTDAPAADASAEPAADTATESLPSPDLTEGAPAQVEPVEVPVEGASESAPETAPDNAQ